MAVRGRFCLAGGRTATRLDGRRHPSPLLRPSVISIVRITSVSRLCFLTDVSHYIAADVCARRALPDVRLADGLEVEPQHVEPIDSPELPDLAEASKTTSKPKGKSASATDPTSTGKGKRSSRKRKNAIEPTQEPDPSVATQPKPRPLKKQKGTDKSAATPPAANYPPVPYPAIGSSTYLFLVE